MTDLVRYQLDASVSDASVAVLSMDDGKANALSHEMIQALHATLDRAEKEASAVLLLGRERRMSAGFDLATMTKSVDAMQELVISGAELLLRMYLFPRPLLIGCTGHALAAGALLLLVGDERLGPHGAFKIGLNEVSIQMPLPIFAVELARDRLSKRHFSAATMQARIYDPTAAIDAGYLDTVVGAEDLIAVASERARVLAKLPGNAFQLTKERARGATVRAIRETLQADVRTLTGPQL